MFHDPEMEDQRQKHDPNHEQRHRQSGWKRAVLDLDSF